MLNLVKSAFITAFIILNSVQPTYAHVCKDFFRTPPEQTINVDQLEDARFLAPNEVNPEHAMPILNTMKPGTLVSVGTERGFLYAGISTHVRSLLLVDIDPAVVMFNRINVALLKAAKNREDYLYLRLNAGKEIWQSRGILDSKSGIWEWWRKYVQYDPNSTSSNINFFMHDKESGHFTKANYLFFDKQFARVKELADNNRISATQGDLGNPATLSSFSSAMGSSQFPVTAVDISNVWESQYAGYKGTDRFLKSLKDVIDPQAIFIFTDESPNSNGYWQYYSYQATQFFSVKNGNFFWDWFEGARLENQNPNSSSAHLEVPPPQVRAVLDGQLGGRFENLTSLLGSPRVRDKYLALSILTETNLSNPRTVETLMKLLADTNETIRLKSNEILEEIVKTHGEYDRQILKFALRNRNGSELGAMVSIVSKVASTRSSDNPESFLRFFYEVLQIGQPKLYMIKALESLDSMETNKTQLRKKLVQLRSRLESFNSYYANFIREDHVGARIRNLDSALGRP